MTKKIELKENEILALNVRLDYFGNNLFIPSSYQGSNSSEYSCYIYLDKSNKQHIEVMDKIRKYIANFCDENGLENTSEIAKFIVDGDKEIKRLEKKALAEGKKPFPNNHMKNKFRLKLKSKFSTDQERSGKPIFLNWDNSHVNDMDDLVNTFYRGCEVHAFFGLYSYNKLSSGVGSNLRSLKKSGKGERMQSYSQVSDGIDFLSELEVDTSFAEFKEEQNGIPF